MAIYPKWFEDLVMFPAVLVHEVADIVWGETGGRIVEARQRAERRREVESGKVPLTAKEQRELKR